MTGSELSVNDSEFRRIVTVKYTRDKIYEAHDVLDRLWDQGYKTLDDHVSRGHFTKTLIAPRSLEGSITLGEKYPCPACKSSNISHTLTNSSCNDCDYDSDND